MGGQSSDGAETKVTLQLYMMLSFCAGFLAAVATVVFIARGQL